MSERITIIVEPSAGHGGVLTVDDAMRQVLDFIEMADVAKPHEVGDALKWMLASATTNTPFTAVAEAFSADPSLPSVDQEARQAKARLSSVFRSAEETGELPDWLGKSGRDRLVRIYERTLNGIGRTSILIDDYPLIIVERTARSALRRIQNFAPQDEDLSGEEYGSIEARFIEATTHYGKPAIRVRERLSGDRVICILPDRAAQQVGESHSWSEIWQGRRALCVGRIKRDRFGAIASVTADDIQLMDDAVIDDLSGVYDSNFTCGQDEVEYLDDLWGHGRGEH